MTQVPVFVAPNSHTSFVARFNGHNFPDWCTQIQFHLGALDLDLPLQSDKPIAITDTSTDEENYFHEAWEKSNRLSLMFMRMSIASNIKSTLPKTDSAKEFMNYVKERSQTVDKSFAGTLLTTLTNIKFDGSRDMYEHVTEMTAVAAKLEALGMGVKESFLVQFIINSLPTEYSTFQMHYNTMKHKWNVNELQNLLVQEERRLKSRNTHSVHFLSNEISEKKFGLKKWKRKGPLKVNGSSSKIHKKDFKNDKCRFCGKQDHFQKTA